MKNQSKKQIDVIFKIAFILYLSVIIFCCSTQQKMMIVIGGEEGVYCRDTLFVKDINLSIKKGDKYDGPIGCMNGIGYSIIFTGIDTLYFSCVPIKWLYLKEGEENFYETTVDTASLRRLNDTLMVPFFRNGRSSAVPFYRKSCPVH